MTSNSIFWAPQAMVAVLIAAIAAAAGSHGYADELISLRQPTTTLVITAATNEEVAPVAQPSPMKKPIGKAAPFTPHYLCLCPPYCPKPLPCVDCCYKCCPDCYCSKPMPCPSPCYKCTCDDYCPKPMPCCFPQPLCGPRGPCRQSEPCPLYAPWPARGPCAGP